MASIEQRRKTGKWYAYKVVPKDVRAALGKTKFFAPLDTTDRRTARARADILDAKWKAEIARARLEAKATDQGATDWLEGQALFWRRVLADAPADHKEGIRQRIMDEAADMTMGAAISAGVLSETDPAYDDLPAHDDMRRFVGMATGEIVRLSDHLDPYLATLRNEARTVSMKRSTIRRFLAGHPYAADVTRKAVQAWIDEQAAGGAAVATLRRCLSEMRGFWSYLQAHELAPAEMEPFHGITVPKAGKRNGDDERQPFDPAHVVRLHRAAEDAGDRDLADVIAVGMWTGARLGEICALRVGDVDLEAGSIRIADSKTDAGRRTVPIHDALMPTIRRLVGKRGDGFLLAGLDTGNRYSDRSTGVGKRFGRLKSREGFGPVHVFHSVRKTVSTLLENAGVSENVAADILGHEKPRITYGLYSGGSCLEVKREAINRISYP